MILDDLSWNRIQELTEADPKTLMQRMVKLTEEQGEVAEALLSYTDAPGCGYKGKGQEDVVEEACDVILVLLSIVAQVGGDPVVMKSILASKIRKWEETSCG